MRGDDPVVRAGKIAQLLANRIGSQQRVVGGVTIIADVVDVLVGVVNEDSLVLREDLVDAAIVAIEMIVALDGVLIECVRWAVGCVRSREEEAECLLRRGIQAVAEVCRNYARAGIQSSSREKTSALRIGRNDLTQTVCLWPTGPLIKKRM